MVTPEELAQLYYYCDGKLFRTTTRSRWKEAAQAYNEAKKKYHNI